MSSSRQPGRTRVLLSLLLPCAWQFLRPLLTGSLLMVAGASLGPGGQRWRALCRAILAALDARDVATAEALIREGDRRLRGRDGYRRIALDRFSARLAVQRRCPERALGFYVDVLRRTTQVYGEDHLFLAWDLLVMGDLERMSGHSETAATHYGRAASILERYVRLFAVAGCDGIYRTYRDHLLGALRDQLHALIQAERWDTAASVEYLIETLPDDHAIRATPLSTLIQAA